MSQHCRHCDGGPNIDYPCLGISCGHEAELTKLRSLVMERDRNLKLLEEADTEIAALRAALVIAEEMATGLDRRAVNDLWAREIVARFHAAGKVLA